MTPGAGALGGEPCRVPHRQTLAGVDYVDYGGGPDRLQVLQVGPGVTSGGKGNVNGTYRGAANVVKLEMLSERPNC